MDVIYSMPKQNHRLFINFIYACPNACFFCVDFKGDTFYGFDLKNGKSPKLESIIKHLDNFAQKEQIKEIYFCGIGEPLLRYDDVKTVAQHIRKTWSNDVFLGINTSGTYYLSNKNVNFADYFDIIQISLNAEDEEKYNAISRPKNKGTFKAVQDFLVHLKQYTTINNINPRIELSVVDTSITEHLPESEKYKENIPVPDFDKCKNIADSFNWGFKIKKLIEDCEDETWTDFSRTFKQEIIQ